MSLHQLVYVSVATVPTRSVSDVSDILAQSVPGNRARGVTGVLAFTGSHFVQILEGAPEDLDALLANLATDPRHRDMVLMERISVSTRSFANCAMLAPMFTPAGQQHLRRLVADGRKRLDAYRNLFVQMVREQSGAMAAHLRDHPP